MPETSPGASAQKSQRWAGLIPLLIGLAGMCVTLALFMMLETSRREALDESFRHDAASRVQLITTALDMRLGDMRALGRYFAGSELVTRDEFSSFVKPWLEGGNFLGFAWLPDSAPGARAASLPYVELGNAADRTEIETGLKGAEASMALEQAFLSQDVVASRPVIMGERAYEIIALRAGYEDRSSSTVFGFLELHGLLNTELGYSAALSMSLKVRDASQSGSPVIHDHLGHDGKEPRPGSVLGRLSFLSHYDFAGRNFIFEFRPTTSYRLGADISPWFMLISGTAVSVFLSLYMRSLFQGLGKAERKAQAALEDFQLYFTTALDLFAIADTDGHFLRLNPQWESALGWPIATLQGARFLDYVHPDDLEATLKILESLKAGKEVINFANRYRTASGHWKTIEWRSIVGVDGRTVYAAARDISDRIQMENSVRRSLREKEALLKEIHHRVKNNLQIISSMLDLQTGKDTSPGFAAAVEEAQGRIRTMALIHEQLYRQGDFASIDFGAYADELASSLVRDFAKRPVALSVDVRDFRLDLSSAISCGLVLNELITNALKYGMPEGSKARIAVSAFLRGDEYVLRVADSGPGMDPDALERGGTSLGLSLVRGLADQLGGSVRIAEGPGAVVELAFPVPRAEDEPEAAEA